VCEKEHEISKTSMIFQKRAFFFQIRADNFKKISLPFLREFLICGIITLSPGVNDMTTGYKTTGRWGQRPLQIFRDSLLCPCDNMNGKR